MDDVAASAPTVAVLLDEWLAHIEHLGRSPSTLYGYRRLVAQLPAGFTELAIDAVTPKRVDDLYRLLGTRATRAPATVLRFHALLRAAFAQALRWEWIERNPIQLATPPRVRRPEITPPAVADVMRVLALAASSRNPTNALAFRVLAATGCRRGEVCGLQWQDLDLDRDPPTITIRRSIVGVDGRIAVKGTKTDTGRTVTLDTATASMLREHAARTRDLGGTADVAITLSRYVFEPAPGCGDPLQPSRLSQAWRRLCAQAGVRTRLHDLRHLHASLLLDAGEAITTVAVRLGHRDTATTLQSYAHLMPGADARAARVVGEALGPVLTGRTGVMHPVEVVRLACTGATR